MRDAEVNSLLRATVVGLVLASLCVLTACQHDAHQSETTTVRPASVPTPTPVADIDARDRAIIEQVKSALPPQLRPYVVWMHVPVGPGYELLPNRGLLVSYDMFGEQDALRRRMGLYVLYFDGRVHTDSNLAYFPEGKSILMAVPSPFSPREAVEYLPSEAEQPASPLWMSDETSLDPVGRAIIAQVRAKMPAALRKCVVWARVPPGKPNYEELPDHGLIVMFHLEHEEQSKKSRPGYSVLYYEGSVHVDTGVVYVPGGDTYLLSTPAGFDYARLDKSVDYSHCLE